MRSGTLCDMRVEMGRVFFVRHFAGLSQNTQGGAVGGCSQVSHEKDQTKPVRFFYRYTFLLIN
jgi:hypothetical protein